MKVKLDEILNGKNALSKILSKELPIKIAYKLSKIVRVVTNELRSFDEQRQALIRKYGEDKDGKGNITVMDDKLDDFQKEVEELLTLEVELDIELINLDDLGDISISAIDLTLIEKFLAT